MMPDIDKALELAEDELLTCPFCGCLAAIHHDPRCFSSGSGYRIECEGTCHGMTCWWHSKAVAVAMWNHRALVACREPVDAQTSKDQDPNCGACYEKVEFEQKYCHMCGRSLNWREA